MDKTPRKRKRGLSGVQACVAFDVSDETLRQWEKKSWLVRFPDRSIDEAATRVRVDQFRDPFVGGKETRGPGLKPKLSVPSSESRARPRPDSAPDADFDEDSEDDDVGATGYIEFTEAKRLEKIEDARRKRLKNEILEGSLIPRDVAIQVFGDAMAAITETLSSLPVRYRHKMVGMQADEIERVMRTEVTSILSALKNALADIELKKHG